MSGFHYHIIKQIIEEAAERFQIVEERATRVRILLEAIGLMASGMTEPNQVNAVGLRLLRDQLLLARFELEDAIDNAWFIFYYPRELPFQTMDYLLRNDITGFERYRNADDFREQIVILLHAVDIMAQNIERRLWPIGVLIHRDAIFQTWLYIHMSYFFLAFCLNAYHLFAARDWGNWPDVKVTNASAAAPNVLTVEESDWHRELISHIVDVMSEIHEEMNRARRIRDLYADPPPFNDGILSDAEIRMRFYLAVRLLIFLRHVYTCYHRVLVSYGRQMFERTVLRLLFHCHQNYGHDPESAWGLYRIVYGLCRPTGTPQVESLHDYAYWQSFFRRLYSVSQEIRASTEFLEHLSNSSVHQLIPDWFKQQTDDYPAFHPPNDTFNNFLARVTVVQRLIDQIGTLIRDHLIQFVQNFLDPPGGGSGGPGGGGSGGPGGAGPAGPGGGTGGSGVYV